MTTRWLNKWVPNSRWLIILENQLPINQVNILGQRFCDPKEIESALATRGGFDKTLFRPVFAIAVKKDIARKWVERQKDPSVYDEAFTHGIDKDLGEGNLTDYALFTFDGKHRGEQLRAVDPMRTTFPAACVYFVDSVEKGNWLFNEFNERSLTKVSPEVLFINDFLAGSRDTINAVKKLKDVGVCICDRNDFMVLPESAKRNTQVPSITANPFKLLSSTDWHPEWSDVQEAFQLFHEMLEASKIYNTQLAEARENGVSMKRVQINSWIIHGLAMLIRHRPDVLNKPQPRAALVAVLAETYDYYNGKQSAMIKGLRSDIAVRYGYIGKEAENLNSSQLWAVVFAGALNEHGVKHGVKIRALQDATRVSTLWDDIQADLDARSQARAKAKLRAV